MIKQIQELEIEVIRKNVKNINLTVLPPDGHVRVSVPFGLSEERLAEFLCSKTDWIRVHRQKVIERAAKKEAGSALRNPEMSEEERKEILERYREFLRPKLEEYLAFWGEADRTAPGKMADAGYENPLGKLQPADEKALVQCRTCRKARRMHRVCGSARACTSEDCQSRCGLQSLFVAVYAGLASAPKAAERTLNQHVLLF